MAADVFTQSFRVLLGALQVELGLVVCVHSFGSLLNFHPHLHVMASDGGLTPDRDFHIRAPFSMNKIRYDTASSRRSSRPIPWSARTAAARCGSSRSSRSGASCAQSSSIRRCGTKPGRPQPRRPRRRAHLPSTSTCLGWSDLYRAAVQQSAQSQRTSPLTRLSGLFRNYCGRSDLEFSLWRRDNPDVNQAITTK